MKTKYILTIDIIIEGNSERDIHSEFEDLDLDLLKAGNSRIIEIDERDWTIDEDYRG